MHPETHHCVRRETGFTLVELLVVIGIIGVLAALTFPMIQGSMSKSRQSACASNLHQVYTGLEMYRNDHDSHLFPPSLTVVASYVGSKEVFHCHDDPPRRAPDGTFDDNLLDVPHTGPRAPFQNSVGFIKYVYEDYTYLGESRFRTLDVPSRRGVLVCPFHAARDRSIEAVRSEDHMFPRNGPILRITVGGSLFVWQTKSRDKDGRPTAPSYEWFLEPERLKL